MKKLRLLNFLLTAVIFISCKKNNSEQINPTNRIVVTGSVLTNNGQNKPCYWDDKLRNDLPVTSEFPYGEAQGAFSYNKDLYIAGFIYNDWDIKPCYWKNGQITLLPSSQTYYQAIDIAVVNNDVYVLGVEYSNQVANPLFWKNGQPVTLNTSATIPIELVIVNAEPVIVFNGGYLKGDVFTSFHAGSVLGVNDAFVAGSDIYFSGSKRIFPIPNFETAQAVYWKNNEMPVKLSPDDNYFGSAYGIFINNNIPYVSYNWKATENAPVTYHLYNGTTSVPGAFYIGRLVILNGNIYQAGIVYDNYDDVFFVENNSTPVKLPDLGYGAELNDMIIHFVE